jgi:uncharacterized membrane protein YphA (DoxX/SURF4 family)
MWNYVFAFPLIMHGLANLAGVAEVFGSKPRSFADKPWIFSSRVRLQSPLGRVFGVFWLLSSILLVAGGLGLLLGWSWWMTAVLFGSIFSFIAIVPWWKTVVPGAHFGAIFDLLVILALLVFGDQIFAQLSQRL